MKTIFKTTVIFALIFAIAGALMPAIYENTMYSNAYQSVWDEYNTKKAEYDEYVVKNKQSILDYNTKMISSLKLKNAIPCSVYISLGRLGYGSIGNEIEYRASINGEKIILNQSQQVPINLLSENEIIVEAIEHDPAQDDVGRHKENIVIPLSDLVNGKQYVWTVTVTEYRGRYAGSHSNFQFEVKIKTAEKYKNVTKFIPLPTVSKPERGVLPNRDDYHYSMIDVLLLDRKSQLFSIALLAFYFYCIIGIMKENHEEQQRVNAEKEKRLQEEKREAEQIAINRQAFLSKYANQSLRNIAHVPSNISFDHNGLPIDNNDSLYGSFTVYLSKNGSKYHQKPGCSSAYIPRHIFKTRGYSPCSRCNPPSNKQPKWYIDYKKLLKEAKSCCIDISELQ